eukprot:1913508-Pleurochrysis_carterae.AAC.1
MTQVVPIARYDCDLTKSDPISCELLRRFADGPVPDATSRPDARVSGAARRQRPFALALPCWPCWLV